MSYERYLTIYCILGVALFSTMWLGFDRATAHVNYVPTYPLDTCAFVVSVISLNAAVGLLSGGTRRKKKGGDL